MFVLQSQISAKQNKFLGISAIRPHIRAKWHIVHCACAKRPNYYFRSKIWGHHRVHRPGFPTKRGNFGDSWTFKADIAFFILAWVFRTSGSKMGIFRGEIGEGVRRYWPPTNSFLLLGVYTSASNLVKIDEEMRPWECPQTDTHTHTHGQTQNDFVICPMLYAIAMGQRINVVVGRGAESAVQVKEIVERVREQRPGMVQTEAQYKFLYDIIPHIVQAQKTVLAAIDHSFALSAIVVYIGSLYLSLNPKSKTGGLKMREWKMRYGQNCKGGKCGSGNSRSRSHGWKMQEWKMQEWKMQE